MIPPIDGSDRTLPPPPPPPKTVVVQHGDTVQSVADQNHVSPQDLADANHISTSATLTTGEVLTIPDTTGPSATTQKSTPPQTPQQRVSQAVAEYDTAVKSHDGTAILSARQAVFAAVAGEIGPQVDQANAHIPPEFQPNTADQIKAYGNVILGRYSSDPNAQGVLTDAINDYQIQRQANNLIPQFYGNFTPQEKLDTLKLSLQGQPQAVVARALQNPSVQRMLSDAAAWAAQPYNGTSTQGAQENIQAALTASQRLADLTKGLPPAYAQQIVQQSMPTIQKITSQDANALGAAAVFANLSNVVGSLGDPAMDGPQVQNLTNQIAHDYQNQYQTWDGRFDQAAQAAVANGSSPRLALAIASQYNASYHGNPIDNNAPGLVNSVAKGIQGLQQKVSSDMSAYSNQLGDLSWLAANNQGKLTPERLQTAISRYIAHQSPAWQTQLRSTENQLTSDTAALNADIGAMQIAGNADPALRQIAPSGYEMVNQIGKDPTTQKALQFTASRDPGLFSGPSGDAAAQFWIQQGANSKDLTNAVVSSYISTNVISKLQKYNPRDPASVAQVNAVLDSFQSKAQRVLGLPSSEVNPAIQQLKRLMTTLQNPLLNFDSPSSALYKQTTNELSELKDFRLTNGAAAAAFRSIGFVLSGAAAINQIQGTQFNSVSAQNVQNIIGSLGQAAGAVQDGANFATSLNLIDADGAAGQFGLGLSTAGRWTSRFVGVANALYFAVGTGVSIADGKYASAAANALGFGGSALAVGSEILGVDGWTGPVGWGITIVATAALLGTQHIEGIAHHSQIEDQFLRWANVDPTAAAALSSDALQETDKVQQQLGLSADQLLKLAANHPGVFDQGPGTANAVIDAAKVLGLKGGQVQGFLDAAKNDNPRNYLQILSSLDQSRDPARPLAAQANLFQALTGVFPSVGRYAQTQNPSLFTAAAKEQRQADIDFDYAQPGAQSVAGLLHNNHNAAYQAEIINIMNRNGTLKSFVQQVKTQYNWGGYPQTVKNAIEDAQSAGVLTASDAGRYLSQLGFNA